ncbi:hypothetical protein Ciccas_009025 [Cichlidogyrus casuarinus]|uniref:Ig-like domain-containing protein n=1 Tax=Cichlidogyrus casuarinus TaxID=1844966 RepID=A0ABD2PYN2_9PLAT
MKDGQPIKDVRKSWEFRRLDDEPIETAFLAEQLQTATNGSTVNMVGMRPALQLAKGRCVVIVTKTGSRHVSPYFRFQPTSTEDSPPIFDPAGIDLTNLDIKVVGLIADGSLSKVEGDNVTLSCSASDRPGGLRGQCVAIHRGLIDMNDGGMSILDSLGDQDSNRYLQRSPSFVIHVQPKDGAADPYTSDLPTSWIPGEDTVNSVQLTIEGLEKDGKVKARVGDKLSLTCLAKDTKTGHTLSEKPNSFYKWEMRKSRGGETLGYQELASGGLEVRQSVVTGSEVILRNLYTPDSNVDKDGLVFGRCVYHYAGKQIEGLDDPAIGSQQDYSRILKEGDYADLNCYAIDKRSGLRISQEQVKVDWLFIDENGAHLQKPLAQTEIVDGGTLSIQDIVVLVDGLDDSGQLKAEENSDLTLSGRAVFSNGQEVPKDKINWAWEWRNQNDEPIDMSTVVEKLRSSDNSVTLEGLKPGRAMKGRIIAVYTGPTKDNPNCIDDCPQKTFSSSFFNLVITPINPNPPAEDEQVLNPELRPKEGKNDDMLVSFTGPAVQEDGTLNLSQGSSVELQISMKKKSSGESISDTSDPSLHGYSYQVVQVNGEPTSIDLIADSVEFDSKTGSLKLDNIKATDQILRIRPIALVNEKPASETGPKGPYPLTKYSGPYSMINIDGKASEGLTDDVDLPGKKYTVLIPDVDEQGQVVVSPGQNLYVKTKVVDSDGKQVYSMPYGTEFSWQFVDSKGDPVTSPALIASSIQKSADGTLELKGVEKSAVTGGYAGRAIMKVPYKTASGQMSYQTYSSDYFKFTAPATDEPEKPDDAGKDSEDTPTDQERIPDYDLEVVSSTSPIFKTEQDTVVVVSRREREFDVSHAVPAF